MEDAFFREILNWRMCSDPWPGGDVDVIDSAIDAESKRRGYADWVYAYHEFRIKPKEPERREYWLVDDANMAFNVRPVDYPVEGALHFREVHPGDMTAEQIDEVLERFEESGGSTGGIRWYPADFIRRLLTEGRKDG